MTVSVVIAAHNEESTIGELVLNILRQTENGFTVKEILVLSDASTDDTVARVSGIDDARVRVIESPERLGQNRCQNTLFRMAEGDIVVFLEADMAPHSVRFLEELVSPIVHGNSLASYASTEPWLSTRGFGPFFYYVESAKVLAFRSHRRGRNIYTCHSGKAVLRSAARNLNWPPDVAEDAYFYLFARCTLRSLSYAHRAVLYYHAPSTLWDYLRESVRYKTSRRSLISYFTPASVRREYALSGPIAVDFFAILLRRPHYFTLYVMLLVCARTISLFVRAHNPSWSQARSTKLKYQSL